jgi:hypothetical protein
MSHVKNTNDIDLEEIFKVPNEMDNREVDHWLWKILVIGTKTAEKEISQCTK